MKRLCEGLEVHWEKGGGFILQSSTDRHDLEGKSIQELGARVAQSVEHLTSAHVVISQFVSLSLALG